MPERPRVLAERREQARRERELLASAFAVAPARMSTAAVLTAVTGLLPVAFVVAASALIAHAPAAIRAGDGTHAWHTEELYLAGLLGVFFAQQLLFPLAQALRNGIAGRVDGAMRDRLMAAAARPDGIAALDDEVADCLRDAVDKLRLRTWGPGAAAAAFLPLAGRYVQVTAAAVVVSARATWWTGPAILVAAVTIRTGYRRCGARFFRVEATYARARRRRSYVSRLLLSGGAAKEIRVFGLLDWLLGRHEQLARAVAEPLWRIKRETFLTPFISYGAASAAILAAAFAVSAHDAASGALTLGGLALVLQAGFTSVPTLGGYFANSDTQIHQGSSAFDALRRSETLLGAPASGPALARLPGDAPAREIRFERVGFGYDGNRARVFSDLDLAIPAGRSLAIVGANGAGKTTLVKLLCRLYEPDEGRIVVDGLDLRAVPAADWQRKVAVIFQDFVRYEATVAQNVAPRLGATPADARPIWEALEAVGARELVEGLPLGLDTMLSRQYADGTDLSGGEWQRLALARALLAVADGAHVLVLDEPTANLDVRAEAEMFDRFLAATAGVTTVLVSHRFSTVRRASSIVVLDEGRVVESGTHNELVAAEGIYARLFSLQAERFREPTEEATP